MDEHMWVHLPNCVQDHVPWTLSHHTLVHQSLELEHAVDNQQLIILDMEILYLNSLKSRCDGLELKRDIERLSIIF
uniref:Uncharacterized protein n=1 Tax=Arundo donax TaxID=35708 RepID=A0A0A9GA95_ARUDO